MTTTSNEGATAEEQSAPHEPRLKAAISLGQSLLANAFWSADKSECNWMGTPAISGMSETSYVAVGPDLYGGSAGIALVLGELFQRTKEKTFVDAAIAAIVRTINYINRKQAQDAPLSFFSGRLGVLYVAHRLASMTDLPWLQRQVGMLLGLTESNLRISQKLDLMGGVAGAIPVLLTLAPALGHPELVEWAIVLGRELCQAAQWDGAACAWRSEVSPGTPSPPLTGLAHGGSGYAFALLELYSVTGDPEFLKTGRGAFSYEDTLFSSASGNWPDLRPFSSGNEGPRFVTAWCHGAAGIALARLRALATDPAYEEAHEKYARAGVKNTIESLERMMVQWRADTTLCHGILGLCEILALASGPLKDPSLVQLANDIGGKLLKNYGTEGGWPSGTRDGRPNPSLMLGDAGLIHHFLRMSYPSIPSILLLGIKL
jgi:lantibiotic biosynthesis protein